MCWSFEVSILSGLFSYTVAAYLWMRNYKNDRWFSMLLFTFSSIQWLEAIIWYASGCSSKCNGSCGTGNVNANGSLSIVVAMTLIPIVIAMEPVVSLYGAHYMGNEIATPEIVIYGLAFIFILYSMYTSTSYPDIIGDGGIKYTKGDEQTDYQYPIGLLLFGLLAVYPLLRYNNFGTFYVGISVAFLIALTFAVFRKHSIASSWCLYSNVFAGIVLFYPYLA